MGDGKGMTVVLKVAFRIIPQSGEQVPEEKVMQVLNCGKNTQQLKQIARGFADELLQRLRGGNLPLNVDAVYIGVGKGEDRNNPDEFFSLDIVTGDVTD